MSTANDIVNYSYSSSCLFILTSNNIQPSEVYVISNIPSDKEGISGACFGLHNIGMNIYLTEERKRNTVKVIEFITSHEFQFNHTLKYGFVSPLDNNMMENCDEYLQCLNFKSIQPRYETNDNH